MSPLSNRRFVILAAPRSGSNMLCSMLGSHPDILCHHELFNPGGIFYALHLRDSHFQLARSMQERDQAPLAFLEKVWHQHGDKPCVGFKMTYQQNRAVFDAVMAERDIRKIVLRRKNVVKSHVSKLIAEQSGVWEDYGQARRDETMQIELNFDQLQQDAAFNQRYYAQIEGRLREAQQDCLQVQYEQLPDSVCQQQILAWLGCSDQPLNTLSRKQNPVDLRLRIKNFDRILAQCKDQEMLAQLTDLRA